MNYPVWHCSITSRFVIDWVFARMTPTLDDAALPPGMVSLRCIDPVPVARCNLRSRAAPGASFLSCCNWSALETPEGCFEGGKRVCERDKCRFYAGVGMCGIKVRMAGFQSRYSCCSRLGRGSILQARSIVPRWSRSRAQLSCSTRGAHKGHTTRLEWFDGGGQNLERQNSALTWRASGTFSRSCHSTP
jgi:hypothetical protein